MEVGPFRTNLFGFSTTIHTGCVELFVARAYQEVDELLSVGDVSNLGIRSRFTEPSCSLSTIWSVTGGQERQGGWRTVKTYVYDRDASRH